MNYSKKLKKQFKRESEKQEIGKLAELKLNVSIFFYLKKLN